MKTRNNPELEVDHTPSEEVVKRYRHSLNKEFTTEESLWLVHYRGGQVEYEIGKRLCQSVDPYDRSTGCVVLGQLGWGDRTFLEESVDVLIAMLCDPVIEVVIEAAYALGHRRSLRAIEFLLPLAAHENLRVRGAAAGGLSGLDDLRAVAVLIELSRDSDEDNRSWAMFGLGTLTDLDTPELREALLAGLHETNPEIRGEALIGLARRGDTRVVQPLLKELKGGFHGNWPMEAAELTANPIFVPILRELWQNILSSGEVSFAMDFEGAIAACEGKPHPVNR